MLAKCQLTPRGPIKFGKEVAFPSRSSWIFIFSLRLPFSRASLLFVDRSQSPFNLDNFRLFQKDRPRRILAIAVITFDTVTEVRILSSNYPL